METPLTDKATPQEAAELQDTLERGYKRAYEAAREAWGGDPWRSGYESRFQTAAECNQVAADVVYETLASGMRRPAEPTADFLARVKADVQTAEAKRAGFVTSGQIIRAQADADMNPGSIEQQKDATTNAVLGCDELGEYHANDDPLTDPANRQLFEEDMDWRLAQRDIADTSLMDAAAAMRSPRPKLGLYQLHACLDDTHLDAARQLIADAATGTQPEAEAG